MDVSDERGVAEALSARLKRLGLTEYESRTLVALMQLGTGTAKEIAEIDGVPRTRVYDAVDTLRERGLVDVQHTTPQKFTIDSPETIVSRLEAERRDTINEVAELSERLDTAEPRNQPMGAWTVTGRAAVDQRVREFVDEAESEIVYMSVDEFLTDDLLDRLRAADERGLSIHLAGVSGTVRERIQSVVPSANMFETLWEWSDTPAGRLLITDTKTALVSARLPDGDGETAIWGTGERNSLVAVLRAIFTWRLDHEIRVRPAGTDGGH